MKSSIGRSLFSEDDDDDNEGSDKESETNDDENIDDQMGDVNEDDEGEIFDERKWGDEQKEGEEEDEEKEPKVRDVCVWIRSFSSFFVVSRKPKKRINQLAMTKRTKNNEMASLRKMTNSI